MVAAMTEVKVLSNQVQELSRERLVAAQERETTRDELNAVMDRVKRMETQGDVKSFSSAAAEGSKPAAAVMQQGQPPEKTRFLLFTGMREAKTWDQDEEHEIRQFLSQYQCNHGIRRVERLGGGKWDIPGADDLCWLSFWSGASKRSCLPKMS